MFHTGFYFQIISHVKKLNSGKEFLCLNMSEIVLQKFVLFNCAKNSANLLFALGYDIKNYLNFLNLLHA